MKSIKTLWILSLFLLASCVKTVFEHYSEIPNNTWNYKDAKQFEVNIKDEGLYDISILIRNTDEYIWNNLWVNLETKNADGKTETERYNFKLADFAGRWLGKGPGKLHDQRFLVKRNIQLKPGSYTFILQHNMREENVTGIAEAGMQLIRVK